VWWRSATWDSSKVCCAARSGPKPRRSLAPCRSRGSRGGSAWTAPEPGSEEYVGTHLSRIEKTLSITPKGEREDRILEMGAYLQMTPLLRTKLGYGEVRGCYFGPAGHIDHKAVTSAGGERFECAIDLFDRGRDPFPYPDGYFTTVLCCELLEHLAADPDAHDGGDQPRPQAWRLAVLTTPNLASLRADLVAAAGLPPRAVLGISTAG